MKCWMDDEVWDDLQVGQVPRPSVPLVGEVESGAVAMIGVGVLGAVAMGVAHTKEQVKGP